MSKWAVRFDDDSEEHHGCSVEDWNNLPKHGVLWVREFEPVSLIHMGLDYYWWEGGTVKSCSRPDIDRYLERTDGIRNVKFGRWADQYIWETAHEDLKKVTSEDCGCAD